MCWILRCRLWSREAFAGEHGLAPAGAGATIGGIAGRRDKRKRCPSSGAKKKNPQGQDNLGGLNKCLAVTYFRMGTPTLSSALSSFTSEFGMVSGGTHSLLPPGKPFCRSELARERGGSIRSGIFAAKVALAHPVLRDTCTSLCNGRSYINSESCKAHGMLPFNPSSQTAWVLYGQASRSISTG